MEYDMQHVSRKNWAGFNIESLIRENSHIRSDKDNGIANLVAAMREKAPLFREAVRNKKIKITSCVGLNGPELIETDQLSGFVKFGERMLTVAPHIKLTKLVNEISIYSLVVSNLENEKLLVPTSYNSESIDNLTLWVEVDGIKPLLRCVKLESDTDEAQSFGDSAGISAYQKYENTNDLAKALKFGKNELDNESQSVRNSISNTLSHSMGNMSRFTRLVIASLYHISLTCINEEVRCDVRTRIGDRFCPYNSENLGIACSRTNFAYVHCNRPTEISYVGFLYVISREFPFALELLTNEEKIFKASACDIRQESEYIFMMCDEEPVQSADNIYHCTFDKDKWMAYLINYARSIGLEHRLDDAYAAASLMCFHECLPNITLPARRSAGELFQRSRSSNPTSGIIPSRVCTLSAIMGAYSVSRGCAFLYKEIRSHDILAHTSCGEDRTIISQIIRNRSRRNEWYRFMASIGFTGVCKTLRTIDVLDFDDCENNITDGIDEMNALTLYSASPYESTSAIGMGFLDIIGRSPFQPRVKLDTQTSENRSKSLALMKILNLCKGKEDRARITQKKAKYNKRRAKKAEMWLHAGEVSIVKNGMKVRSVEIDADWPDDLDDVDAPPEFECDDDESTTRYDSDDSSIESDTTFSSNDSDIYIDTGTSFSDIKNNKYEEYERGDGDNEEVICNDTYGFFNSINDKRNEETAEDMLGKYGFFKKLDDHRTRTTKCIEESKGKFNNQKIKEIKNALKTVDENKVDEKIQIWEKIRDKDGTFEEINNNTASRWYNGESDKSSGKRERIISVVDRIENESIQQTWFRSFYKNRIESTDKLYNLRMSSSEYEYYTLQERKTKSDYEMVADGIVVKVSARGNEKIIYKSIIFQGITAMLGILTYQDIGILPGKYIVVKETLVPVGRRNEGYTISGLNFSISIKGVSNEVLKRRGIEIVSDWSEGIEIDDESSSSSDSSTDSNNDDSDNEEKEEGERRNDGSDTDDENNVECDICTVLNKETTNGDDWMINTGVDKIKKNGMVDRMNKIKINDNVTENDVKKIRKRYMKIIEVVKDRDTTGGSLPRTDHVMLKLLREYITKEFIKDDRLPISEKMNRFDIFPEFKDRLDNIMYHIIWKEVIDCSSHANWFTNEISKRANVKTSIIHRIINNGTMCRLVFDEGPHTKITMKITNKLKENVQRVKQVILLVAGDRNIECKNGKISLSVSDESDWLFFLTKRENKMNGRGEYERNTITRDIRNMFK